MYRNEALRSFDSSPRREEESSWQGCRADRAHRGRSTQSMRLNGCAQQGVPGQPAESARCSYAVVSLVPQLGRGRRPRRVNSPMRSAVTHWGCRCTRQSSNALTSDDQSLDDPLFHFPREQPTDSVVPFLSPARRSWAVGWSKTRKTTGLCTSHSGKETPDGAPALKV